jgi:hypothetical protein
MSRLVNIKESDTKLVIEGTSLEVGGVQEYVISRQRGSVGVNFTVTFPKVETDVAVGDGITFKGINGVVTSKEVVGAGNGFATMINGVSKIGELLRKAPLKSLMYMSMTPDEKDEFIIACEGDYSSLDYVPLIKICDPKTFTGGWTSNEVINDLLVNRAGFQVVCNVYDFWLRQVNASDTSSYFETVMSFISFLKPTVYEQDGIIYLLERPMVNGMVNFGRISNISQRYTYSFDSKAQYFRVTGGYGRWRREMSKVKAVPEKETVVESKTYSDKPIFVTLNIRGEKPVVDKMTGSKSYEFGGGPGDPKKLDQVIAQFGYWSGQTMRDEQIVTETWRLDPFGNFKALLSRRTVKRNLTLDAVVLDRTEEFIYDFLTEEFDRPRLMSRKVVEGKYSWVISQGLVRSRAYKGGVAETNETWDYADNGTLLQEIRLTSKDCVKLSSGNEYIVLDVADTFYREEGSPDVVNVERMVVEEAVTTYRQINYDLYEKSTTIRKLGPLARKVGEENHIVDSQIIKGRVPRHPKTYRKMIVEYDNIPDEISDATIDVPVITISNPNIIDWDDAKAIFERLKQQVAESNVTERTVSVPGDIPVDVGWKINLPAVFVGKKLERPTQGAAYQASDQLVTEIDAPNYSWIVAYEKRKNAGQPYAETKITVEAK